ncbi:GntR family transcriptional regulator [Streptomyces sp. NPDC005890]|uniref:GntR family transcriptional regulator n=1 Tax=Streptomyces sp. NPDC005890 TaxID=3154568 RepID=UPI0033FBD851
MSGAAVRVDTTSPVPPYEQIRAQLAALIGTGRLREGERLPTVRQLAADLGLAAGTVARAYRELEAASLIRTRRGAGTRVAAPPTGTHRPDPAELAALARTFVAQARALGATEEEALGAVRGVLRE